MTDLIARLRDEHVSASRTEAADRIEQLAATCEELVKERDAALAAQSYTYIGKDMKPVLARDLEAAKDIAEAKLTECEARLGKAMEMLRWYADFDNYLTIKSERYAPIDLDKGGKAEDTLAELEGKDHG